MLQIAHLSNSYWAEAIQTACYLQNCFYTSALTQATPFELWTSLKPDLSHLRIFGCPAFSQIPDEKCSKLETKALQCVFVGYGEPHGVKGYRLYHPETRRLFFTRDVIFSEDQLLSKSGTQVPVTASSPSQSTADDFYLVLDQLSIPALTILPHQPAPNEQPMPKQLKQADQPAIQSTIPPHIRPSTPLVEPTSSRFPSPNSAHQLNMSPHLRAHLRQSHLPGPSSLRKSQRSSKGTWHSTKFHDETTYAYAFLTQVADPSSISEALSSEDASHWLQAIETEYNSLIKNNIWILVDRPPDRSLVSTKWFFQRKYNSDGTLARYKARFVARGFFQQADIDYSETFSPVIKMTSLRLLLALATIHNYHIHQMDVTTAFLSGTL
jgi:hypothetical protein